MIKEEYSSEILFLHAVEAAERNGLVEEGDIAILTAGVPLGTPGKTNILRACVVGDF